MFSAERIPLLLDAIGALIVLEAAGLVVYRRVTGRGMPTAEVIAFLGAGGCMLGAVRVVATGGPFALFAVAMLGSLGFHVLHIVQRWRG